MRENARKVGELFKKGAIDEKEIDIYKQVLLLKPNNKEFLSLKHVIKRQEVEKAMKGKALSILKKMYVDKLYHALKK